MKTYLLFLEGFFEIIIFFFFYFLSHPLEGHFFTFSNLIWNYLLTYEIGLTKPFLRFWNPITFYSQEWELYCPLRQHSLISVLNSISQDLFWNPNRVFVALNVGVRRSKNLQEKKISDFNLNFLRETPFGGISCLTLGLILISKCINFSWQFIVEDCRSENNYFLNLFTKPAGLPT